MTALGPEASTSWPSIRVTAWVRRLPPTKRRKWLLAARGAVSGGPVGVGKGVGLAAGGGAEVSTTASGLPDPEGAGLEVQPAPTNAAKNTRDRKGSRRRIGGPILGATRRSQVSRGD
jgi:hypothetical protein